QSITDLYNYAGGIIYQVDTASLSGFTYLYDSSNAAHLRTSASSLDLSNKTIQGFTVDSTNATGTTFTVNSLATAFSVVGGSGNDTLVATGFSFTAPQRDAIFATSSIETITDPTGSYTAPAPSSLVLKLTTGADTLV